jgi:hypothetical protein
MTFVYAAIGSAIIICTVYGITGGFANLIKVYGKYMVGPADSVRTELEMLWETRRADYLAAQTWMTQVNERLTQMSVTGLPEPPKHIGRPAGDIEDEVASGRFE